MKSILLILALGFSFAAIAQPTPAKKTDTVYNLKVTPQIINELRYLLSKSTAEPNRLMEMVDYIGDQRMRGTGVKTIIDTTGKKK